MRVITQPPGLHEHDYRAVKTIYFGLRCPESTMAAVMETLAGREVSYLQVISPQYGAILTNHLKPEHKQYAAYLSKAAEIVRREPYRQEVQSVDFSSSKSTPQRPVIYVQYLRAPNKWVNHYLTLPEIDEQYTALDLPNAA